MNFEIGKSGPLGLALAAQQAGLTREGLRLAIARGELRAQKLPGRTGSYVIQPADLEAFIATRAAGQGVAS